MNALEVYLDYFRGNPYRYGIQQPDGTYYVIKEGEAIPYGVELLKQHLTGEITVAIYQNELGYTHSLVIDIDQGENEPDEVIITRASNLYNTITARGLVPLIEWSGRRGFHLWLFFNSPVKCSYAHAFGKKLVVEAGLPKSTEIYPLPKDNPEVLGHLIKLPLCEHKRSGSRSTFLRPDFVPVPQGIEDWYNWFLVQIQYLQTIPFVTLEQLDPIIEVPEPKRARAYARGAQQGDAHIWQEVFPNSFEDHGDYWKARCVCPVHKHGDRSPSLAGKYDNPAVVTCFTNPELGFWGHTTTVYDYLVKYVYQGQDQKIRELMQRYGYVVDDLQTQGTL